MLKLSRAATKFPPFPYSIKNKLLKSLVTRKLTLSNGLKVCLISDPLTPTSGAALSIEAGSWFDGAHAGTAHFLEHMLFLGTAKYPSESDYERYIYDSNGSMNGYTANDHSMYYFSSLSPDKLEGALDRFSRFFYEPLFNSSCINREMNAVDEEYRKNIESDSWRAHHVLKDFAVQTHPFSMFNTGNLETMKLIDQSYMKKWFKKHYIANRMCLVVHGKNSLSELQTMVELYFSPIKSGSVNEIIKGSIFRPEMKGKVAFVNPIKDLKRMTIIWEISHKFTDLTTKPAVLIGEMLGHEGTSSLLSMLKKRGLVEGLSAGPDTYGHENSLFEISLSLTDEGLSKWNSVLSEVYAAISELSKLDFPIHAFDEANFLSKVSYEFQDRSTSIATSYCSMMRLEPMDSFPLKSLFIERFDPQSINELLKRLIPETSIVMILAKQKPIKTDLKEKWMGAEYGLITNSATALKASPIEFAKPNKYLPTNLSMSGYDSHEPVAIVNQKGVELYHFADQSFNLPETYIMFNLKTPRINPGDARSLCLAALFNRFVKEKLNEHSYDASVAGLSYNVWTHQNVGIALSVNGYSEKSLLLWRTITDALKNPQLDSTKFEIYRKSQEINWKNSSKNSSLQQSGERFTSLIMDKFCPAFQLGLAMESITFDELVAFSKELFELRNIQGYVGGNASVMDATEALGILTDSIPGIACSSDQVMKAAMKPTSIGPSMDSFDVSVGGNAIYWNTYIGKRSEENRAGCEMFTKLLKEPFYSELRTVQQTGYVVHSGSVQTADKHMFINAAVQSNTYDARDLLSRIELFMQTFVRDINENPQLAERLESVKASTIARLKEPFDKLASKHQYYNHLVYEENCDFKMLERRVQNLKNFNIERLQEFANEKITNGWNSRLSVLANGNSTENKLMTYKKII